MSDTSTPIPSLADRVRPIAAGGAIVGVHFFGRTPVFVLGEEALLFASEQGERRVSIHAGGILASTSDGIRILTGGDDGTWSRPRRAARTACSPPTTRSAGSISSRSARTARWPGRPARPRTCSPARASRAALETPSTVAGLAFAPKGFRLAIAHYNGVTLWFPNAAGAAPETLEWKGSHLAVAFSPDGKFLVTCMQEPTLHGWRLADAKHMRMSGYSARVRSLGWTADGEFLATSGSEQLILWPFDGKDGPMGRAAEAAGGVHWRASPSSPAHPRQPVVAVGYADGRGRAGAHRRRRADRGRSRRRFAGRGLGLGRRRADLRLRHRGGRSRRFVVLIAAPLRRNNSAAVQLAWTMVWNYPVYRPLPSLNRLPMGTPK